MTVESELAIAQRHADLAQEQVDRQRTIIEALERAGEATQYAKMMLQFGKSH